MKTMLHYSEVQLHIPYCKVSGYLILSFLDLLLRFQARILGYSIAGMKAFEGKFSYKNQLFS